MQISEPLKLNNNDSNLEISNIFDCDVSFSKLNNKIFPIFSAEKITFQPNQKAKLKYYIKTPKNNFSLISIKNTLFNQNHGIIQKLNNRNFDNTV